MGYKILEDIDVSVGDFQTMLDELTDAKNSPGATEWIHAKAMGIWSDSQSSRSFAGRALIYLIWTLKVDSGGLLRCATSVEWRR